MLEIVVRSPMCTRCGNRSEHEVEQSRQRHLRKYGAHRTGLPLMIHEKLAQTKGGSTRPSMKLDDGLLIGDSAETPYRDWLPR